MAGAPSRALRRRPVSAPPSRLEKPKVQSDSPRPQTTPVHLKSETASDEDLREVFAAYRGHHDCMDGNSFVKLCKDSDLVDGRFTEAHVDIVFTGLVLRGQRRITVDQFYSALHRIAE